MKTLREIQETLTSGKSTSAELTEHALARIADPNGEGARAFVRVFAEAAMSAARHADKMREHHVVPSPLAGIPFSVKDLCDVRGCATTAGSIALKDAPAARQDAPVLARLRAAGAIIVGTTNMTEFAMGTPGTNAHYGTPLNAWDRTTGRIPGGSSSGCAVSITDEMAYAGLGTDTAGSVRVPAALCGLVGFKPTARRVPVEGIFPLSPTLDSVGPLAASVACCNLVDAIFAGDTPHALKAPPTKGLRLGALDTLVLDDLDATVAKQYDDALRALRDAGASIESVSIAALSELPELNKTGGFSSMEAYAFHRDLLAREGERYDPYVRARIESGKDASACDYLDLLDARRRLISAAHNESNRFDALVFPTCPIVAPPVAELDTAESWGNIGRLLLRNNLPSNFLDRCAVTLPCHRTGEAPVGITLLGEHMGDRDLLNLGAALESVVKPAN